MNSGNTHPNLGQRDTPQDQQQQSTHGHANGQTHWHGAKKTKTELVIDFLGSPWCQRRGSNEEIRFSDAVFGWIDPVFMEQPEVSGVLGCIWILCWSNINPQWDVFRLQADDEVSLVSLSYKVLCFKHTIGSYWVPSQVPIDWSRPQSLALWTHSGAFQTAAVGAWRVDHKPFLGHQKKAAGSFCKLLVRQNPWDISSCFLFSRRLENNASEGDSELFLCILRWIPLCQHFCFFCSFRTCQYACHPMVAIDGQLKSARDDTMNEIWAIPKLGHTPKLQFLHWNLVLCHSPISIPIMVFSNSLVINTPTFAGWVFPWCSLYP